MEAEMIKREGIAFEAIPAAGIHGVGITSLPGNILRLLKGYFSSRSILNRFNPDVLFFTGGYVAVPMALAGISCQSLLYVPDVEPGLALKTIAHFSDHIAVSVQPSLSYFSARKKVIITGYPTRPDLMRWDQKKAREFFGIQGNPQVLLILGGSKGARSINLAVAKYLSQLLTSVDVIHLSGQLDYDTLHQHRELLPHELKQRYHLLPYLHEMGAALAAADLAVSRAGASILGEYPLFGLPSILAPYPYAWRYQKTNADYLVERGAAVVLADSNLDEEFYSVVTSLLSDPPRLATMGQAARSLATPNAAGKIAAILVSMAGQKKGGY